MQGNQLRRVVKSLGAFALAVSITKANYSTHKRSKRTPSLVALLIVSTALIGITPVTDAAAAVSHHLVPVSVARPATTQGQAIVNAAASEAGKGLHYCWDGGGTTGPTHGEGDPTNLAPGCSTENTIGFDCTGLTLYAVYQGTGGAVRLTHGPTQADHGGEEISRTDLLPGDVVYFGGTLSDFVHAGIYAGDTEVWNADTIPATGVQRQKISWFTSGPTPLPFVGAMRYWTSGGGTPPPPPSLGTSNMLSNASFGEGNFNSWTTLPVTGGGVNVAAYKNSAAHDGSWYGESNTSTAGGSVLQDVAVTTQPGQSYSFSIWIRSPTGAPVSGTVALWGLGGTTENGLTNFTVGSAWTLVTAPLDVSQSGHTELRAQIYEFTTNTNYDFDGAQLVNDGLSNASFGEGNFNSWQTDPVTGGGMNVAAYKNSAAHDGSWYGESNTSTAGGSVLQDVAVTTQPGQSYSFSIWIRSPTGAPVSGTLALWGLGGTTENGLTNFTVGSAWTLVTAPLDVSQSGHTELRAQIYEFTTNTNYDFDGAQLVNDGLSNASFGEGNFNSWQTLPVTGGSMNVAAYKNSAAHDGSWYGESNTSTAGGSVLQDVAVTTQPGQSYSFSIWIRSPAGVPVSGTVALWGLGGTTENGLTNFTVGSAWTLVTAPLDVSQSGHTELRAQIYEFTTNTNYDFDGATFASGDEWTPNQAPSITSGGSATFDEGSAQSFIVTATGAPTPDLTETGILPNGVTFADNANGTATLAGTPGPGSKGDYRITIAATNGVPPPAVQTFTLTVAGTSSGYDLVGSDGGVFVFPTGQSGGFFGSLPGLGRPRQQHRWHGADRHRPGVLPRRLRRRCVRLRHSAVLGVLARQGCRPTSSITGIVAADTDKGYFLVGKDGGVFAFGTVPFLGSLPGKGISVDNIIGIASTPSGNGYWVVSATGTVYGFGAAQHLGTAKGTSSPVSAIAGTPTGGGYWITTQNGTVYTFGNAKGFGTLPALGVTPNLPVIGIVHTAGTAGYWLIGQTVGSSPSGTPGSWARCRG